MFHSLYGSTYNVCRHMLFLLRFCSAMIRYITLLHYLLVRFEYLVWTCIVPFTISTSVGYIVEVVKIK
jgi:hypothetical protein